MMKFLKAYKSYWNWLKGEDFILYLIINIFNYLLIFYIVLYFILSNMAIAARFKDMSKELTCYDRIESTLKEKYPSFRKLEIELLQNGPRYMDVRLEFVFKDKSLSKKETREISYLIINDIEKEISIDRFSISFDIFSKDNEGSYIDIYNGFFKCQNHHYIYDVERNRRQKFYRMEKNFNYREL